MQHNRPIAVLEKESFHQRDEMPQRVDPGDVLKPAGHVVDRRDETGELTEPSTAFVIISATNFSQRFFRSVVP